MKQSLSQNNRQIIGKEGEKIAALYLETHGYTIVASNYKGSFGEIDLIVRQGNTLAFVEVKARNNTIVPLESLISPVKQKRILQTAKKFIFEHNVIDMILRFDVLLIKNNDNVPSFDHIQSAFLSDE